MSGDPGPGTGGRGASLPAPPLRRGRRRSPGSPSGGPGSRQGFTLVEILMALVILASTAVVLLGRRVDVVRDAARAKDQRALYVLASQKMAELELDVNLRAGPGGSSHGDFGETDPEYAGYTWEYALVRERIELTEPGELADPTRKPVELFRLTLGLVSPNLEEPLVIEAYLPIHDPAAEGAEENPPADPSDPDAPKDPADPAPPAEPPPPGGSKP